MKNLTVLAPATVTTLSVKIWGVRNFFDDSRMLHVAHKFSKAFIAIGYLWVLVAGSICA
jgi:hypothetical protein